ncbi:MAG: rane protein [Ilumatobacteraceae bacterium]|nr:rane protein [Ilumatobacteraceae bacterium]
MADSPELDADGPSETPDAVDPANAVAADPADGPARPSARARSGLDRRTVAIAAVLGIAAALLTVLIASAFTSGSRTGGGDTMELKDPAKLLRVPLTTTDGGTTTLDALREEGKPTLVNLWQAACVPCVREMPTLDAAQADNPDITFLGVNTQEPLAKAEKLADQTGITYPWVLDPDGELYYEASGQGMPTTFVLDADGTIVASRSGPFADADDLQAFLDQAT